MFDLIPSYFEINISILILLIITLISAGIAYYLYRQVTPPLHKTMRIILGTLRALVLAGLILLLFVPEITAIWQEKVRDKLIILIDKSGSMGIKDRGSSRIERSLKFAERIAGAIGDQSEIRFYAFDSDTIHLRELRIDSSDSPTNLSQALKKVINDERDSENLILLSDGNFTQGENPLFADEIKKIRILTVGFGDTSKTKDLRVTDIKKNDIVFQNKSFNVSASVAASGINNEKVVVSLRQNSRIISRQEVLLGEAGQVSEVDFPVSAKQLGLKFYNVSVERLKEEKNIKNNQRTFSVQVLKDKIRVGLIAAGANFDTKFVRQLLNSQQHIRLYVSIYNQNGRFFLSDPAVYIDSLDVAILMDYPASDKRDLRSAELLNRLQRRGIPVLMIYGDRLDNKKQKLIKQYFPVNSMRNSRINLTAQVKPTAEVENFPFFTHFESKALMEKFWTRCPPVDYPFSGIRLGPAIKVLLTAQDASTTKDFREPVMLAKDDARGRGVLLLGSGFWRWHFLLIEDRQYRNSWQHILLQMIRWLDSAGLAKNVILTTSERTATLGEPVNLSTQVYNGNFQPENNALVRLGIDGPSAGFDLQPVSINNGIYAEKFIPEVPGKYKMKAEAWVNDLKIGADSLTLSVLPFNQEFLSTDLNRQFLKALAQKTGGHYFNENQITDLINQLVLNTQWHTKKRTIELWQYVPFLLIIILILSFEWLLRKRKGLI